MTSEGIPVSDRQEGPSNSGEGSPQVKSMRMPGGEIVPMTLYLDGTSSMPIYDPATGVTLSEHYTREQTSQLMEVVREVEAGEDPGATHTPEQQPSQEERGAQPLSGVVELPEGDALEQAVKDNLDAKYPPIKPEDVSLTGSEEDEDARLAAIIAGGEPAEPAAAEPQPAPAPKVESEPVKQEGSQKTPRQLWLERVRRFGRVSDGGTAEERSAARAEMNQAFDELLVAEREAAESIRNEFDALTVQYAQLGDDASPEARRDIEAKLLDAQLRLRTAELSSAAPTTPETGSTNGGVSDLDRFRAEQNDIRQARLREERQSSLKSVEEAFKADPENRSIVEGLELAQKRYTQLKAKSETWGRWGRKKREVELKEAEQSLKQAELTYAKAMTDAKKGAGLLESEDPAERRNLQGEELFGTLRGLVNERRTSVREFREQKIENANLFMKAAAGIGNFFNGGGKWAKRLKAGGVGVGVGAAKTAGVLFSGIGWPITIPLALAAGTGVGLGIRGVSVVDTLNKQVDAIGDMEKDDAMISDEVLAHIVERFKQSSESWYEAADRFSQKTLELARQQGYDAADAARAEGRRAMGRYGVGFGIGSAATLAASWASGAWAPFHSGGSVVNAQPNEGTLPSDRYPTGHEFHAGADRITNGEGWFHQFRDMGMTDKQAHALFGDDSVMKQLVDAHAAYVDNSARIGGYGINMPKGGHLSAKAMEIIGKAMDAKGF